MEDYDFWLRSGSHGYWGCMMTGITDWYRRKVDVQSNKDWKSFVNPPNFKVSGQKSNTAKITVFFESYAMFYPLKGSKSNVICLVEQVS